MRADDLGVQQLRLIERAREFLIAEAMRGVDVAIAPECYLSGWARVPGAMRLRSLARGSPVAVRLLGARARDVINVARHSRYEVSASSASPVGLERLVVSWCQANDFSRDGAYTDRYFRTSSRDTPTTMWFLISVDDALPIRVDSNIRIFHRRPGTPRIDVMYLLRRAAHACFDKKPSADGAAPAVSAAVTFAEQLEEVVVATLEAGPFTSIVMPYEAQPFQHAVFRAARRCQKAIRTVGYLHSALPPMPTDLIHRTGAPELLFVHGRGQADILTRHLGWPNAAVRTIRSLRYRSGDTRRVGGFIYLPYSFTNARLIETAFRDFLAVAPDTMPRLTVRNHPMMQQSVRHRRLQRRLEAMMGLRSQRLSEEPNEQAISVFVGATAAIVEALERGAEVIHICSQPLLESHSARVWAYLEVERLGAHVFRYRLPVRGAYIEFGGETDTFERYFGSQLQAYN